MPGGSCTPTQRTLRRPWAARPPGPVPEPLCRTSKAEAADPAESGLSPFGAGTHAHPGRGAEREKRGSSRRRTHSLEPGEEEKEPRTASRRSSRTPGEARRGPRGEWGTLALPELRANGEQGSPAPQHDMHLHVGAEGEMPPGPVLPKHLQVHGSPRGSWPESSQRPGCRTWAGHAAPSAGSWRPALAPPKENKRGPAGERLEAGWSRHLASHGLLLGKQPLLPAAGQGREGEGPGSSAQPCATTLGPAAGPRTLPSAQDTPGGPDEARQTSEGPSEWPPDRLMPPHPVRQTRLGFSTHPSGVALSIQPGGPSISSPAPLPSPGTCRTPAVALGPGPAPLTPGAQNTTPWLLRALLAPRTAPRGRRCPPGCLCGLSLPPTGQAGLETPAPRTAGRANMASHPTSRRPDRSHGVTRTHPRTRGPSSPQPHTHAGQDDRPHAQPHAPPRRPEPRPGTAPDGPSWAPRTPRF